MANTEAREDRIERLLQRVPTMAREAAEEIVDALENGPTDEQMREARSMKANSLRGTMDPMYT